MKDQKIDSISNLPFVQHYGKDRIKVFVTLLITAFFFIFYQAQNLFFCNNLNDFAEYFLRAEKWVHGEFFWGWGIDKLLSIIEYFPIRWFKNDFFKIYNTTVLLITLLLFTAIPIFLLRKNDALPSFSIKCLAIIVLLSMPVFILQTLTIDQTLVFAVMLIFFLSTYNNPYMGFVGLLVCLSRPEGFLVFGLYLVLIYVDKSKRKQVLINFLSFIAIYAIYQYINLNILNPDLGFFQQYSDNTPQVMQSNSVIELAKSVGTNSRTFWLLALIKETALAIIYLPLFFFMYAMDVFQNYIYSVFFIIGLIFSVFNKKMYPFIGIIIIYILLIFVSQGFHTYLPLERALEVYLPAMKFFNSSIEMANGYHPEFEVSGHSRYRLFLYFSLVFITVAGMYYSTKYMVSKLIREKLIVTNKTGKRSVKPKSMRVASGSFKDKVKLRIISIQEFASFKEFKLNELYILCVLLIFFLLNNAAAYKSLAEPFKFENQMKVSNTSDLYQIALKIRETKKPDDIVFLPVLCYNGNESFLVEFEVFSGLKYMLMPVCDSCPTLGAINFPKPRTKGYTVAEIEKMNPSKIVLFEYTVINYKKSFNDSSKVQIDKLFNKFDLTMLDSLRVKYIISTDKVPLNKENLKLTYQKGELQLYQNMNIK